MKFNEQTINHLYERIALRSDISGALEDFQSVFGCHCGSIIERTKTGSIVLSSSGLSDDTIDNYLKEFKGDDPIKKIIGVDVPNKEQVIVASRQMDLFAFEKSDYYRYVQKPSDINDMLCFIAPHDMGFVGFNLYKPKEDIFTDEEIRGAQLLLEHMRRSLWLLRRKNEINSDLSSAVTDKLTSKEVDVLRQFILGRTRSQASDALQITQNTTKYHLKNIYQKLGVRNISQLVLVATARN